MRDDMVVPSADGGDRSAAESHDQAEALLHAFVSASSDIVFRMNADWTELREICGRGVVVETVAPRRDWMDAHIDPDDQPGFRAAIAMAISNRSVFEMEHQVRRIDGARRWVQTRAVPMFDAGGRIGEWLGGAVDITEQRALEQEIARLMAAADQQRRLYESLIGVTPDLVYAFDRDYRFIFANQALLEMWGRTLDQSVGKRLREVGYEPWHAEMHEREIDQVIATRAGIRGEVGFEHAVKGWRIYDYIFMPVLNAQGEVESIAGTTRDITDIKRSEEHLRLLVNELNHRVKNTLVTVQSLAKQTFRGGSAEVSARAAFEERLIALSNAHTVLTRSNWESARLRDIVVDALAPFAGKCEDDARFGVQGGDVELTPQTALALAMALHELASNAVKYGALSADCGRIAVTWQAVPGRVSFVWRESDGPPVAPPERKGFGSRLLEQRLARELNGAVHMAYPATGVVCSIDFPVIMEGADNGG